MALIISVFPKKEIMISEQIHSPHKASQCVRNLFSAGVSSKLTVFCFKACDSTKTSAERERESLWFTCSALLFYLRLRLVRQKRSGIYLGCFHKNRTM